MKNRYLIIFTLVFGIISFPVVAQVDFRSFPLDSFSLPDIDRRALTGSGSLFGHYTGIDRKTFGDSRQYSFSPNVSLDYDRFRNSPTLQSTRSISLDPRIHLNHTKSILGAENSNTNINTRLLYSGTTRKYKGRSFSETGLNGLVEYGYDKRKTIDTGITSVFVDELFSIELAPSIGFGKGRLEPVSDVAMAMFILKDAEDLGLDLSMVTTADIYAFARLMAEVSNRRIFDSRRMRIAELRDLYSFMLSKDWVIREDPGFFTVLTDNWNFTNVFSRLSGKRWTYLLQPQFIYTRQNPNFNQDEPGERTESSLSLIVDYRKYQPLNLYHDHWHAHTATFKIAHHESDLVLFSPLGTYGQFSLENEIGRSWFPNNRTSILGSIHLDYSYYRFFDDLLFQNEEDQHVINPGAEIQSIHFLSYKTRLVFGALLQYGYSSGGALIPIVNNFYSSIPASGFHASLNASIAISIY